MTQNPSGNESIEAQIEALLEDATSNTDSKNELTHILWLADGIDLWHRSNGKMGHSPADARRYMASRLVRLMAAHDAEVDRLARIDELDRLIDINGQTFNRWTQKDIAHLFEVLGKRYRELEQLTTNQKERI